MRHTSKNINIFIVADNLTIANIRILKLLTNNTNVNLSFLETPSKLYGLKPDRGSQSQFYRLFVDEIFTDQIVSRVLFLDADTLIVSDDFEQIFSLEMHQNVIASALDPWSRYYRKVIGLPEDTNMFNSGVILIDIDRWKKESISDKITKIIKQRTKIVQGDQGILNKVFHGDFEIIDPKFNVISSYFELSYDQLKIYRKPINFYSKNEIESATDMPIIVHFTSTFLNSRPWQGSDLHPYSQEWNEIFSRLALSKKVNNVKRSENSFMNLIYKLMPSGISIRIFGLLQAYVRPFLQYFIKNK